jgi:copper chaperone
MDKDLNMENIYNFKTSIKCGGCISTVTPFLKNLSQIEHWEVDLNSTDKILSVRGKDLDSQLIIDTMDKAGYSAELIL